MPESTPQQLVAEMTLAEKIGQMTQASMEGLDPSDVADHHLGSVLSGGSDNPSPNEPRAWADMVDAFTQASEETRLGIPILYGVDAVHGHSNVRGATVFPHNIGLGAIDDVDLMRRIGEATATEMLATGIQWTFAPAVSVARDIRWGRTYESYGRDPDLVGRLAHGLIEGLADPAEHIGRVLACAKHFVGDGATGWDTVEQSPQMEWWSSWGPSWSIDQGDARISEDDLRSNHLGPYVSAIDAGAMSIMASYSSWNGEKLHGHRYLLTDVLKTELGFEGFVVSDWMGVDQLAPSYDESVVRAINAGVDMVMVPFEYRRFIEVVTSAVRDGSIALTRIDDAVVRILTAKAWLKQTSTEARQPELAVVGSAPHRAVAAEAARRSAVLLKNDDALPLAASTRILLGGDAADDIGLQCGGWTAGWQGSAGPIVPGVTFREALARRLEGSVTFAPSGDPDDDHDYDFGILCVAEEPYAEGPGDRPVPTVREDDHARFSRMRSRCRTLVVIVYSGRPVVIPDIIDRADAVIAAWLPGSEATQLPDLLLGDAPFEGRLPQPWPESPNGFDTSGLGGDHSRQATTTTHEEKP
jgi:beta-glucosidase